MKWQHVHPDNPEFVYTEKYSQAPRVDSAAKESESHCALRLVVNRRTGQIRRLQKSPDRIGKGGCALFFLEKCKDRLSLNSPLGYGQFIVQPVRNIMRVRAKMV